MAYRGKNLLITLQKVVQQEQAELGTLYLISLQILVGLAEAGVIKQQNN